MSRAIHFTHHVCGEHVEYIADWGKTYLNDPLPFGGCSAVRYKRGFLWTNDPKQVTCKACVKYTDGRMYSTTFHARPSHKEQIKRAWLTCCKGKGAAMPFVGEDRTVFMREQLVETLGDAFGSAWACTPIGGDDYEDIVKNLRDGCDWLATLLARHGLLEAMRPAIAELLLVAEWHEQIDACMNRAFAARDAVFARLASGELVPRVDVDDTARDVAAQEAA